MTKKQLIFGIIGIIIGIGGRYLLFHNNSTENTKTDSTAQMSQNETAAEQKMHAQIEVDQTKPVPTMTIEAIPDSKDGYNLHFVTQNYTLTPEKVGSAPENTGHMHLFVNGVKVARPYGSWFHLIKSNLKDGENTIEVALNANDHSERLLSGEHIAAQTTLKK